MHRLGVSRLYDLSRDTINEDHTPPILTVGQKFPGLPCFRDLVQRHLCPLWTLGVCGSSASEA